MTNEITSGVRDLTIREQASTASSGQSTGAISANAGTNVSRERVAVLAITQSLFPLIGALSGDGQLNNFFKNHFSEQG